MKKKKTHSSKRSKQSSQMEQVKYLLIGIAVAAIAIALYVRVFSLQTSSRSLAADLQYERLVNEVKKIGIGELHAELVPQLTPDDRVAGGTMTGQKLHPDCLGARGYLQFRTNRSFDVVVAEYKGKLERNGWEYFQGLAEFRNVHNFYDPAKMIRLEIFQTSQQDKPLSEYLYAINFSYGYPEWASCNGV